MKPLRFQFFMIAYIIFLVIAILIAMFLLQKKHKTILILGPVSSGKTRLFYELQGKKVETVTSIKENIIKTKDYTLIDFPGHLKLQHRLKEYAEQATRVVFLATSVDESVELLNLYPNLPNLKVYTDYNRKEIQGRVNLELELYDDLI